MSPRLGLLIPLTFTLACCSGPAEKADPAPASAAAAKPARAPKPIPTLEQMRIDHPPEMCALAFWEDGDTPTVDCAGRKDVVRMLGIDTAESGFDDNSKRRAKRQVKLWGMTLDQVFACGKAATARVKVLCPVGSPVEVVGTERGHYGRRLAYVVCQGVNLNARLVEEGLAGRYPYPGDPEKPSACPLPSPAPLRGPGQD